MECKIKVHTLYQYRKSCNIFLGSGGGGFGDGGDGGFFGKNFVKENKDKSVKLFLTILDSFGAALSGGGEDGGGGGGGDGGGDGGGCGGCGGCGG